MVTNEVRSKGVDFNEQVASNARLPQVQRIIEENKMNNENIFDQLPAVGQLLMCVAIVMTVPLWFPFWILQGLKQDRIEKQILEKLENEEAMEKIFQNIRKELK